MEAGENSVIYMGLISGPNKADDTCGPTTVTGTMDRGFTVYKSQMMVQALKQIAYVKTHGCVRQYLSVYWTCLRLVFLTEHNVSGISCYLLLTKSDTSKL
jgi:hypothetical protein